MNRFFRNIWRIRRMVIIWLLLCSIASIQWLRDYAGLRTVDDYNRFAKQAIVDVLWGALLAAAFFALLAVLKRLRNRRRLDLPTTFENKPWMYDGAFVSLTGKVTRVLPSDWDDSLRRRSRNILRIITKDPETVGRYRHLRFLLSTPLLQHGEAILIHHNLDAQEIELEVGDWVEVRGEYIHHRARRQGLLGSKLTTYGKLHHTHEPKGFLRILDGPPGSTALRLR